MRTTLRFIVTLGTFMAAATVCPGGQFTNLDFESAVQPVPADEGRVAVSEALPGWQVWAADNPLNEIWYNTLSIESASASLIEAGNPSGWQVEGQFSVFLYSGITFNPLGTGPASLVQTGLVPTETRSLRIKIYFSDPFLVSLGGNDLDIEPWTSGDDFIVYAADASEFAGSEAELRVTAPLRQDGSFPYRSKVYIHSIEFSPEPIPEPASLLLMSLGLAFCGWRVRRLKFLYQGRYQARINPDCPTSGKDAELFSSLINEPAVVDFASVRFIMNSLRTEGRSVRGP